MLEVTRVWFTPRKSGKLLGFADVQLNNFMLWRGLRLFEGDKGFDVGLPQEKYKNSEGKDAWKKIIAIDFESEDGQALINTLRDGIVAEYDNPTPEEKNSGGVPNDDDVPW